MCGHVGLAGDVGHRYRKMFDDMLIADTVRGPHSTGVAVAGRTDGKVQVARSVGPAYHLMGQKQYDKAVNSGVKLLLGHNRWATTGEIKDWNAHPFEFNSLVGAHNGTLDHSSQRKMYRNEFYDTDSEALFSHMNKHGLQSCVDNLGGAWALVWFDKDKGTLNMLRNDKRDLFYAYSKDMCTIMWASEPGLLRWCAARNGVELYENKAYQLNEDEHYCWAIPAKITDQFGTPDKVKMAAPVKEPMVTYVNGQYGGTFDFEAARSRHQHAYGRNDYRGSGHHGTPTTAIHQAHQQTGRSNVVPLDKQKEHKKVDTTKFRHPYREPDGKIVPKDDFIERVKQGCVMCSNTDQVFGEFVQFMKPDMDGTKHYLCEECYNDDDVRQAVKDLI